VKKIFFELFFLFLDRIKGIKQQIKKKSSNNEDQSEDQSNEEIKDQIEEDQIEEEWILPPCFQPKKKIKRKVRIFHYLISHLIYVSLS